MADNNIAAAGWGSGQKSIEIQGGKEREFDLPRMHTRDRFKRRIQGGLFWLVLIPVVVGQWFAVAVTSWIATVVLNPLGRYDPETDRMLRRSKKATSLRLGMIVGVAFLTLWAVSVGFTDRLWYPVSWGWRWHDALMPVTLGRFIHSIPVKYLDLSVMGALIAVLLALLGRGFAKKDAKGVQKGALSAFFWFCVVVVPLWFIGIRSSVSPAWVLKPVRINLPMYAVILRFGLPVIVFRAWMETMDDLDRRQLAEVLFPGSSGITFPKIDPSVIADIFGRDVRLPGEGEAQDTESEAVTTVWSPDDLDEVAAHDARDTQRQNGTVYIYDVPTQLLAGDTPEEKLAAQADFARFVLDNPDDHFSRSRCERFFRSQPAAREFFEYLRERGFATHTSPTDQQLLAIGRWLMGQLARYDELETS
jgi:hypothetical protein